ncbi:KTSC domain-containing protein [Mesorhizobium sp.]|uniref:KTSC domain-containing protein n=1 Tax=Mesorhizobium sp. TaxID=1871066 RepID=UPI000FE80E81|nr:MAG: KTSC domain-containing protein [Mesorhizobium sp.]
MPSTVIQSINYDPATRTLSVWFVPNGNRYDFDDVPPQTYAAFRKASAKGRFFNTFIRDRYSYHLVPLHSDLTGPGRSAENLDNFRHCAGGVPG